MSKMLKQCFVMPILSFVRTKPFLLDGCRTETNVTLLRDEGGHAIFELNEVEKVTADVRRYAILEDVQNGDDGEYFKMLFASAEPEEYIIDDYFKHPDMNGMMSYRPIGTVKFVDGTVVNVRYQAADELRQAMAGVGMKA